MKKVLIIIISSVFIFSILKAQESLPKIKFTEYDLSNGLHVILHEDHSTPIVAITVLYHVGSKNEEANRTGFAHFFEHLLFEGSENIKRGEYMKMIKNAGGVLNANTTFDRTFYFEILPSNQLALALWMESERMLHAKIDSIGVETQRKVVKEELKQRIENAPYGTVFNEIFAHSYKKHPYRWTPAGSPEYINKAKLSEFMEFYKTFYVPNNAVLSISGDIDIDSTRTLIDKYFTDIPKGGKIPRPTIVEPPQEKEIRDTVYDNIQLPAVVMSYHIPAQNDPEFYAVDMLSKILSTGKSSRLNKMIVDKEEKALFIGSFPVQLEDPGISIIFGIANMGIEPKDLEISIEKEIDKLKTELISQEEFEKLRNQIVMQYVNQMSRNVSIAESLANYFAYYGNTNLINTEIERYLKVTREDIRNAAKKYFNKNNRVVLYYLPKHSQ